MRWFSLAGRPPVTDRGADLFADVPNDIRRLGEPRGLVARPPQASRCCDKRQCPIAAMADAERRLYALLFHPEVAHTERGLEILRNFAYGVCAVRAIWTYGLVCRRGDGEDPNAGRRGGSVCAERRCGFDGRGAHHSSSGGRQADVHLRDNGVLRLNEAAQIRSASSG